jgi:Rha family phage regulatory protein
VEGKHFILLQGDQLRRLRANTQIAELLQTLINSTSGLKRAHGCTRNHSLLLNFEESTYKNERGREYKKYLLTEEAFTLVAMSYTTPEAMKMNIRQFSGDRFGFFPKSEKSLHLQ